MANGNETKDFALSRFCEYVSKSWFSINPYFSILSFIQSIDEDEKVVKNVYTLGGNQEAWFLTENGVYEVLMQSRKPIAKEFKTSPKTIL